VSAAKKHNYNLHIKVIYCRLEEILAVGAYITCARFARREGDGMKIVSTTIMLLAVSLVPALAQQRGQGSQSRPEENPVQRDARRAYGNIYLQSMLSAGAKGSLAQPPTSPGQLLDIDVAGRTILIRYTESDQEMRLAVDPKCKIKAGKKALTLEEVKTGYEIETIVVGRKGRVTEIEVKTP
jgi:hypothetical protein